MDGCAGQLHSVFLTSTGTLYVAGSNELGQLGVGGSVNATQVPIRLASPTSVTAVTCGAAHTLALTTSGAVWAWGSNDEGQLSCFGGPDVPACLQPVMQPTQVQPLPPIAMLSTGGGYLGGTYGDVPSGGHTLAVTTSGALLAWGSNFYGQLGIPATYTRVGVHSLAVTPNVPLTASFGTYANLSRLRLDDLDPATVASFPTITTLADYYALVRADWPGPGVAPERVVNRVVTPSPVAPLPGAPSQITAISAGGFHSMALLATGEIYSWGDNRYGQCGIGRTDAAYDDDAAFERRSVPLPLRLDRPVRLMRWDQTLGDGTVITGSSAYASAGQFTAVAAGMHASMALTQGGVAWVWGSNLQGALGTCGCGACAAEFVASGQCYYSVPGPPTVPQPPATASTRYPPPSPPPPHPPPAPPAPPVFSTVNSVWTSVAACDCACPGHGNTCASYNTTDAAGNLVRNNAGACVLFENAFTCMCISPYASLMGSIATHDTPMPVDMPGVIVNSIQARGGMFAISRSVCPENDAGESCSGNGACVASSNSSGGFACACYDGFNGVACQYTCSRATLAEFAAAVLFLRTGYNNKYPGGAINVTAGDSKMVGLICSGNGICAGATGCQCTSGWAGDHCQKPCYRNNDRQPCSGHGTCVSDPTVDGGTPYCLCDHYNTGAPDYQGQCEAQGLQVQDNGWCAWFDAKLGFASCQSLGLCGICQDTSPGAWARPLSTWAAVLLLLPLLMDA